MKKMIIIATIISLSAFARDPGTGSNTTVGPGPATPDAASDTTSIHGGGTPGNSSEYSLDQEEPTAEELKKMKQKQEAIEDKNYTDQNSDLDTM